MTSKKLDIVENGIQHHPSPSPPSVRNYCGERVGPESGHQSAVSTDGSNISLTLNNNNNMAHFELGGSVSVDQTFQSSFAQELVKECSISCNESPYKSSFATELLESSVSHNNSGAKISEAESENEHHSEENSEENIYENVKSPLSMESNLFLDDTADFRRCSQVK